MAALDLSGRSALVTGSTSGIGAATATKLASLGAHVIVSGRRQELGEAVVNEIRAAGGKADYAFAELRGAASGRDLARRAREAAGGSIDILVGSAAAGGFSPTAETSEESFDRVFSTNVKSHFFLVAELAPAMAANGSGAIVTVSSIAAQNGIAGLGLYGASKAALNLLTKSWAAEFGPSGVRVNAVSPATVLTQALIDTVGEGYEQLGTQVPLRRIAAPEEVADAIAYLVSDQASYINGVVLNVDGGSAAI